MTSSRFVLIGDPVEHSLSPVMHRAAYAALGLPHRYELLLAPDEASVREAVGEVRSGRIAGANVTVPWKTLALELADSANQRARAAGACNVLARRDSGVAAFNTDMLALDEELARLSPRAKTLVVLGGGGAARAVIATARSRGVAEVIVTTRRPEQAGELAALGATAFPWPDADGVEWAAIWSRADVVVQATSAGLESPVAAQNIADLVAWDQLKPEAVAYDLCYVPRITPFLERARAHALRNADGLEMLVLQAAHAFEIWLGTRPALDVMRQAALVHLGEVS
jgi:shikimate dehydrogenase